MTGNCHAKRRLSGVGLLNTYELHAKNGPPFQDLLGLWGAMYPSHPFISLQFPEGMTVIHQLAQAWGLPGTLL